MKTKVEKIQLKIWYGRYIFQNDNDELVIRTFDSSDNEFITMGSTTVEFNADVMIGQDLTTAKIAAYRKEQEKIRAEVEQKAMRIDETIQKLMALTHEEE